MPRTVSLDLLDSIRPASPCPARWEDMSGDDRVRHCAQCDLDVFNIESMSRDEAMALIRTKIENPDKRLCARLRIRADGRVITRDCPVGLDRVRRRAAAVASRIGAAATLLIAFGVLASRSDRDFQPEAKHLEPIATARGWVAQARIFRPRAQQLLVAGDIACPPPPPNVPPNGSRLYYSAQWDQ